MTLYFAANQVTSVREIMHDGRKYLVAPVVALVVGVVNGYFVPPEELSAYAASWAGRPVSLGHPQANGAYISANSPDVWAREVPGQLWNVVFDGDRLKGDIWIDLEKAAKLGDAAMGVVRRLRGKQPVEVSTGYFADLEESAGTFNGAQYIGITRNIRPDHLALLPDEVGACSWNDGCGTPRVNRKGAGMNVNELELSDRIELVRRAFWEQNRSEFDMDIGPDLSIAAIFDGQVIAKDWVSKGHTAYPYTLSDVGEVTFGEPVAIEVVYRAKDGGAEVVVNQPQSEPGTPWVLFEKFMGWFRQQKEEVSTNEEQDMTKQELVAALVANARCKFAKDALEKWDEAALQTLQESLSTTETQAADPPQTHAAQAQAALLPEITAFAAMIQSLGGAEKLGAALGAITANADGERAALVEEIVANGAFTADELATMPIAMLRKLNESFAARDYSAAAGSFRANYGPDEEELAMPTYSANGGGNGE